jgi:DNA-directed RNA polymerase subunit omega
MRDDFFKEALEIIEDPYVLVNMIWARVRMLRAGNRPLIESVGDLSLEDVVLREIVEHRITYILGDIVILDDIVGLGSFVAGRRTCETPSNPPRSLPVHTPGEAVAVN